MHNEHSRFVVECEYGSRCSLGEPEARSMVLADQHAGWHTQDTGHVTKIFEVSSTGVRRQCAHRIRAVKAL